MQYDKSVDLERFKVVDRGTLVKITVEAMSRKHFWFALVHLRDTSQVVFRAETRQELGKLIEDVDAILIDLYHCAKTREIGKAFGIVNVRVRTQRRKYVVDAGFKVLGLISRGASNIRLNGLCIDEFKTTMNDMAHGVFKKNFCGTEGHYDTDNKDEITEFMTWVVLSGAYTDQNINSPISPALYISSTKYFDICNDLGIIL